jgi:hypothetical protein
MIHSDARRAILRHLGWFVLCASLSACKGGLPDLRGRFQGTQKAGTKQSQVVAEIPGFQGDGERFGIAFQVFETLASARGSDLSLSFGTHPDGTGSDVTLMSSAISADLFQLTGKDSCADGEAGGVTVHLCWATGKIDLDATSAGGVSVYSLHILRDDGLPNPTGSAAQTYSLDELVGRAKFLGYSVTEAAERAYQAKEQIGAAQGNLLPHLNLRAIVGLATGERSAVFDAIGSFLPFIFPSNWYRWEESKDLYQAERASFSSLRGNEMNAVEGLSYFVHRDQMGLALVEQHLAWLRSIQAGLRVEERAGTVPTGTADYFGISIARLEQDRIAYSAFVTDEFASLTQGAALDAAIISLQDFDLPNLSGTARINANDFVADALSKSFELSSLQSLQKAAQMGGKEVVFGWLDPEGSQTLNFGLANQIRISQSRQAEIKERVAEAASLVGKRCATVANEYNSAIATYQVSASGTKAVQNRISWLMQRHLVGDSTLSETDFIDQLQDLQASLLGFKEDLLSAQHDWLIAKSKLDRLLLKGFYFGLGDGLPQNRQGERL